MLAPVNIPRKGMTACRLVLRWGVIMAFGLSKKIYKMSSTYHRKSGGYRGDGRLLWRLLSHAKTIKVSFTYRRINPVGLCQYSW